MKFKIYVQDQCDFCKEVEIPSNLEVELVYINRDEYGAFKPSSVPVMQTDTLQLEGPHQINEFLKFLSDAKEGKL